MIKPVLVGIGIGATLAGTVFLLRSQRRTRAPLIFSAPEPNVTNVLLKAALFRLARVAARRAVRAAAIGTLYRVAEAWRG